MIKGRVLLAQLGSSNPHDSHVSDGTAWKMYSPLHSLVRRYQCKKNFLPVVIYLRILQRKFNVALTTTFSIRLGKCSFYVVVLQRTAEIVFCKCNFIFCSLTLLFGNFIVLQASYCGRFIPSTSIPEEC